MEIDLLDENQFKSYEESYQRSCLLMEQESNSQLKNIIQIEDLFNDAPRFSEDLFQVVSADLSNDEFYNSLSCNQCTEKPFNQIEEESKETQKDHSIIEKNQTLTIQNKVTQQSLCKKEVLDQGKDYEDKDQAKAQKEKKIDKKITKDKNCSKKGKQESKKRQYKTKNFLSQFKKGHLSYLQKQTGEKIFEEYPDLQIIRQKDGINRQDYVFMYSISQLKKVWTNFFANKQLNRLLMNCRCDAEIKKNYLKVLYRFEEAFETRKFERIN